MSATQRVALFESAAGKSVHSFNYLGSLYSWQPLSQTLLVVYIRPTKAYLLNVPPCPELMSTDAIGITSSFGRVTTLDNVVLGQDDPRSTCSIERIRPLDVTALHGAKKARQREIDALPRKTGGPAPPQSS